MRVVAVNIKDQNILNDNNNIACVFVSPYFNARRFANERLLLYILYAMPECAASERTSEHPCICMCLFAVYFIYVTLVDAKSR